MVSVLIVDDEKYVRRNLLDGINWNAIGDFAVKEAASGVEAIELINQDYPDILITDIRMPLMSGLELISKAHRKNVKMRTVILSGYEDFQYAREAIRLEVSAYLTKPVDEEQLTGILRDLSAGILREKEDAPPIPVQPSVHNQDSVLYNEWDMEGCTYGLLAGVWSGGASNVPASFCSDAEAACAGMLTREFDYRYRTYAFVPRGYTAALCMVIAGNSLAGAAIQRAGQCMLEYMNAHQLTAPAVILSEPFNSLNQIQAIEQSCLSVLSARLLYPENLLRANRPKHPNEEFSIRVINSLNMMNCALTQRRLPDAIHLLYDILADSNLPKFTPELLEYVVLQTGGFLKRLSLTQQISTQKDHSRCLLEKDYLLRFLTLAQLRADLENRIRAAFSAVEMDGDDAIKKVKVYISSNFDKPITLASIAKEFFFNPNYLSSLFKQKTGGNLSTYLEDVRIKNARNLLENTDLSVCEVARTVGYNDPNYFTRIFRHKTGFTPTQLQKRREQ